MKMRAALAALLLLAAPAFAQGVLYYRPFLDLDNTSTEKADSLFSAKPGITYARRVAMVLGSPGASDAFNQNSVRGTKLEIERSWGNLKDALEDRGIQVDVYSTSLFTRDRNRANFLWKRMGTYYPVTFCIGLPTTSSTPMFFDGDSTSTHVIHLVNSRAGISNFSVYEGVGGYRAGPADTCGAITTTSGYGGAMRAGVKVYQNNDTLWMAAIPAAALSNHLPSSATLVVRLTHPVLIPGSTGYTGTGSDATFSLPSTYDSVATSGQWLGPAWRIYFTPPPAGTPTPSMDFVKGAANSFFVHGLGLLPYALAARYLDVRPFRVALEMDDITDVTVGQNRGTNATWDALMTEFRDSYEFKPTFSVNPLHAEQYIRGTDPTWEDPWTQGEGWSWVRKWRVPWVHHSHDSSAARPTSGLMGRFGGYPNNGTLNDSTLANGTRRSFHRVYANRYDALATNLEKRFGIYNKLYYSDSLRALNCPECPLPPYLSFPGNFALPGNWRVRTNVNNPSWGMPPNSRTGSTEPIGLGYRSQGDCPPDSAFTAMAKGLRIPSGGTLYLRAVEMEGTGSSTDLAYAKPGAAGDNSVFKVSLGADSDTLIANSYFTIPDEEQVFKDGTGYGVKVKAIGYAQNTTSTIDAVLLNSFIRLSQATGFINQVQYASTNGALDGSNSSWFNESYSVDPNGLGQAGASNQKNFASRNRMRMFYMHPRSTTGPGTANYNIEMTRRGMLMPVRALNAFAGKPIIKWVYPWELYQ